MMRDDDATLAIPVADRPRMPEGYGVPATTEGTLPWAHVRARMAAARSYWICTTRADGRPHVVPAWGAWLNDTFYFDAPPGTRRQRNLVANRAVTIHLESGDQAVILLVANRAVTIHLESGDQAVILEGTAVPWRAPDPAAFARVADAYAAKYAYRPENADDMYTVRLRTVLAWDTFPKDATRWRFPARTQ